MLQLKSCDVEKIPVDTKTGAHFGHLIMATFWIKDSRCFDVLYNADGELTTEHARLQALSAFYNKKFKPATLDGVACLINTVTN